LIFKIPFVHQRYCEKIPYWPHASFTLLYTTCCCYCGQFTKTNGVIRKQIINYRRWQMHVTWNRMVIRKVTKKSTKCLWKTKIPNFLPENRGPKYMWPQYMQVGIQNPVPGVLHFSPIKKVRMKRSLSTLFLSIKINVVHYNHQIQKYLKFLLNDTIFHETKSFLWSSLMHSPAVMDTECI